MEDINLISSTPEEAIHLIDIEEPTQEELKAVWQEYIQSPEGKCRLTAEEAIAEVKRILNRHGWFTDPNGDLEFTLFEVERNIMEYLEKYPCIK